MNELVINGHELNDQDKMNLIKVILGSTLSSEKNVNSVNIKQTDTYNTELDISVNQTSVEDDSIRYYKLIDDLMTLESSSERTALRMYNIHKLTKELMDIDNKYGWNHVIEKEKIYNENQEGGSSMTAVEKIVKKIRKKAKKMFKSGGIIRNTFKILTAVCAIVKGCKMVSKTLKIVSSLISSRKFIPV